MDQSENIQNKNYKLIYLSFKILFFVFFTCLLFAGLIAIAQKRLIAKDEGFYLMAALEILKGKTPYIDFFFPQMPLLPYVYAVYFKFFGASWISARIFSGILAALLGVFIYSEAQKRWGIVAASSAAILYLFSNFVFPWYTISKTYSLSVLLLFISYKLTAGGTRYLTLFLAGVFFGLSVETRLLFVGLLPLILLWLFFRNDYSLDEMSFSERLGTCFMFCFGFVLTMIPIYFLFVDDFDLFIYNNLTFHLQRSDIPFKDNLEHIKQVVGVLFSLASTRKFSALQMPVLLYANILAFILCFFQRRTLDLSFFIILGLFVIHLLPNPTYVQYFSCLIPFLIIGVCILFACLYRIVFKYGLTATLIFSCFPFALLMLYALYALPDIKRYTEPSESLVSERVAAIFTRGGKKVKSGDGVIGINNETNALKWSITNVNMIQNAIDRHSSAGDKVLTHWPGYIFATHAEVVPGMENDFAIKASEKLKKARPPLVQFLAKVSTIIRQRDISAYVPQQPDVEDQLKKYHLLRKEDIPDLLKKEDLKLLVLDRRRAKPLEMDIAIEENNFTLVEEIPPVFIYKKDAEEHSGDLLK